MDRARWKRREFLRTAGVASVAAFPWTSAFAEPPPETPTIWLYGAGSALRPCIWLRSCSGERGSRTGPCAYSGNGRHDEP